MDYIFINVNHDVGFESSESIPISQGYILSALKAAGSGGVILDDLRDRPLSLSALDTWINRIDPVAIGFTAYRSTMSRIRFLCRYIKTTNPDVMIMLGGPQAVAMPPEGLEHLHDVDVLIHGEGEVTAPALDKALHDDIPLESVPGITCRVDGKAVFTGPGPEPPQDLDAYPSPYLNGLLNLEGKNTAILLSSRGCRHICRFCITPAICKGKVRYHSVQRTLDEMAYLTDQGIERFWFADPNFTDDPVRTEQLLDEKIRLGIKTPFWCQTRTDLVGERLLKKLAEAGADTIAFGLESGSPGVLEKTKKGIELDQLRQNIAMAQSLGMQTELFSIFGLPGETVEDAGETLKFVQSLGIPIESNSGSQQMQLYFGSIYSKRPDAYGIKPADAYRAPYMGVGEEFTTDDMSAGELRKVRNLWALANAQMETDVYYKQRIFEVLEFLEENREDLCQEPSFHAYGALASSAIEDFRLLERYIEGFCALDSIDEESCSELISSLTFFKQTDQPAGPTDRIIFDSRSWMNGVPFTGINGKYWDVLLGRGLLLDAFEQGLVGAKEGDEVRFSFAFPSDYFQEELQGKEVEVGAKIHKVFTPITVESLSEVKQLGICNQYRFGDLDQLKENNEILYYLALRDSEPLELISKPSHYLMLVHRLAKLGKKQEISRLGALLNGKPTALNAFADTLVASGKCRWAMDYYQAISESLPSSVIKRVRCLLNLNESEKALGLLQTISENQDIEYKETLLECLKAARPDSARIGPLEHNVLSLRVRAALARETMGRGGPGPAPVVHGNTNMEHR